MLSIILIATVAAILYVYSILRYHDLWKRGKAPVWVYGLIHIVSLAVSVVAFLQVAGLVSDVFLLICSAYTALYSAIMMLTPMFCFLRGLVRFLGKKCKWSGKVYRFFNHPTKLILWFLLISAVVGAYGFIHERYITETEYVVTADEKKEEKEMSVVFLSDLRIGSCTTQSELSDLVEKIKEIKPDLVLFGGNTIGRHSSGRSLRDTIEKLKAISAPNGVYLTEGPEDAQILEQSAEELEQAGLHVLQDQCIFLNNGVQLVGCRADREGRKPLSYTLGLVNPEKPSIIFSYDKIEDDTLQKKKVDVALSRGTGSQYGWNKNGTINFLGTAGIHSDILPGKYIAPSEIVKLQFTF